MMSDLELRLRFLKYDIVTAKRKIYYKLVISQDRHQAAVERAEVFAGDFMAYLNELGVWGKLGLDGAQNGVLNALIEAAKTGNLFNHGAGGLYDGQMEWSLEPALLVYAYNSSTSRTTRYQEVPEGELSFVLK